MYLLSWIRRLLTTNTSWLSILECLLPGRIQLLFSLGEEYTRNTVRLMTNVFWKEVLESLVEFRRLFCNDKEEIMLQPIWYNGNINIGNRYAYFKNWYNQGIHTISDLINEDGKLMNYDEFCTAYNFRPIITRFQGLRCAILEGYPELRAIANSSPPQPFCPKYIYHILNNGIRGEKVYDLFVEDLHKEQKYKANWATELDLGENDNILWWKKVNTAVKGPMEVHLRWFQYRIIHRILGTNTFLHKVGIAESPLCTFCGQMPETILHLFWDCSVVSRLVEEAQEWFSFVYQERVELMCREFILGMPSNTPNILNFALIILKYYIYKQRNRNCRPTLTGYKNDLKHHYNLEEYIYMKNTKGEQFQKIWEPFHSHFSSDAH